MIDTIESLKSSAQADPAQKAGSSQKRSSKIEYSEKKSEFAALPAEEQRRLSPLPEVIIEKAKKGTKRTPCHWMTWGSFRIFSSYFGIHSALRAKVYPARP